MIFYFSGTGNSLCVAKSVAEYNKEDLVSISAAINNGNNSFEYTLKENETIGFVFPVYAWGPPKMVIDFIGKLKLNNYRKNYIFSIATCGDNIGNTMKVIASNLKKVDLTLGSAFSLKMPNNYIIMGDVDSKKEENIKLIAAEDRLKSINEIIEKKASGVFQVVKGHVPVILTSVINPLFNKGAMQPDKFYANDKCTSCGICEKVCNSKNIVVSEKPVWGKRCCQCLACIHCCPIKAIQYGKGTEDKGRYINPKVKLEEMMNSVI